MTAAQLAGLTITTGSSTDSFTLSVTATTTDGTATATTIVTLAVTVKPVWQGDYIEDMCASIRDQHTGTAAGNEDTAIALDISSSLVENATVDPDASRSEERRVGKECTSRWAANK